jgi:hypothetical protein
MKTFFIISAFMLICVIGWSQNTKKAKMIPVQMNSGELKDSICVIKLDTNAVTAKDDYFIFTTDINKPLNLFIAKKEKTYFVIKSSSDASGGFDYIVYIKRLLPIKSKDEEKAIQAK